MTNVYIDDFGYHLSMNVETNQTSLTLQNADEIIFKAVGINTRHEVEGNAIYSDGSFLYEVQENDFIKDTYSITLIFKYLNGEVTTQVSGDFGYIKAL